MSARFIQVKVKPNARASLLRLEGDDSWYAELKSPPVDGKANTELIGLIAKHFGCAKSQITIKSGGSGRRKLVQIQD